MGRAKPSDWKRQNQAYVDTGNAYAYAAYVNAYVAYYKTPITRIYYNSLGYQAAAFDGNEHTDQFALLLHQRKMVFK